MNGTKQSWIRVSSKQASLYVMFMASRNYDPSPERIEVEDILFSEVEGLLGG